MKTKQQKIEEYLNKPLKAGDEIIFTGDGNGSKDKKMSSLANVNKIENDFVFFKGRYSNELQKRKLSDVKKSTRHIGKNNFKKYDRYQSYKIEIQQLFWRTGYDRNGDNRMEKYFDVAIPECVLTPVVKDKNGNEIDFQRGLVWTLEQKQLLIDSIYNRIDIGKFVFRKRSFNWVENRVKKGLSENTGFSELIDGKQRLTAILGFWKNEFEDSYGDYFSDLSADAQREFIGYNGLTYVEMPEETTDQKVIEQFLAINHTGVPMSKEHIEFVKSIKI